MRKIKIISVFIIFTIACISHFIYDLCPNVLFSIFFPVNESIWEHMKLISTPIYLYSIIEYLIFMKRNIKYNNFLFSHSISIILSIILFLILHTTIDAIFKTNMFIDISLLFITFIFSSYISYYFMNKNIYISKSIPIIITIFIYSIFIYFTYYPIKDKIFYDTKNDIYGIKKTINYSP